jgi:hypothetical protein
VEFSTALVPQLQLRHINWLASVQSVGEVHSSVPQMLHFLSHGDAAPIVETLERLDDVDQDNGACIPVQQLECCRFRGLRACHSIHRVCIPCSFDYNWPMLCTVCFLGTPNNALCVVVTDDTAEEYVTPFDGEVYTYLEN